MDDTPLDDRLREKWKIDSQEKAFEILVHKYLTPEGKDFLLNARDYADRERVGLLLTTLHEKVVAVEETGKNFLSADMIVVATTLLTAAIATTEYGISRKSWEN